MLMYLVARSRASLSGRRPSSREFHWPVRSGLSAPIMTDFADRVEKVRVTVLGYGSQVEEDRAFLDASDDGRNTLPESLGQRRVGIVVGGIWGRNADGHRR